VWFRNRSRGAWAALDNAHAPMWQAVM
jgi:hypothetical protein